MKAAVIVLLSTFNGAAWLPALLESLENQNNVDVKLIWRDDSSSDDSANIVEKFSGLEKIRCNHIDKRMGAAKSYLHLI